METNVALGGTTHHRQQLSTDLAVESRRRQEEDGHAVSIHPRIHPKKYWRDEFYSSQPAEQPPVVSPPPVVGIHELVHNIVEFLYDQKNNQEDEDNIVQMQNKNKKKENKEQVAEPANLVTDNQ